MTKILYIGEGKIEERFFDFLRQNDFIQPGRFRKFNLMQEKLPNAGELLKNKMGKVYCVLDTDCVETANFDTLIQNINLLKRICPKNVFLLIQNKNFEDELLYLLGCKNLCDKFNWKYITQKDLKRHLAQSVSYTGFISRKNLVRYCRRPEEFKAELKKQKQNSVEKMIVLFESSCIKK